ncbi:MAG TPA: sugar phosphate isomerase/epimerase family protein [Planctomycetota bacterium]|nr:sugar phosphate isomerase/epimerase [Planctomycetota bacterium]HPF12886.1 sugar phosphate isomerase/epimerase family protein [Planctomycetota bacterium]HRV79816.1 sugar phosphate isomerase/epimerase family protein [Planctomycetota bacterium]
MILAYNTNGLAHHRLLDALELCAAIGYGGVAITLDVGHLDPYGDWQDQARDVRMRARDLGLTLAIETGARFLLDPQRKHQPSLLDPDAARAQRRVDFYRRSLEVAHALGAPTLSLWSGSPPSGSRASDSESSERLVCGLVPVLQRARDLGVEVCLEPEPGMWLETPEQFLEILQAGGSSLAGLGLTLDVGHCLVTGPEAPELAIQRYREHLRHVHLDDIAHGDHEHRMFGQGDLDLPAVLASLRRIEYAGMAAVELSRDSHRGADAAQEAFVCLNKAS